MTKVIGISGYSRTGKDTTANTILQTCQDGDPELKCVKRSFAWQLKKTCHDLYGWAGVNGPQHYDDYPEDRTFVLPELGFDVVQLWIEVGQKMREIFQNTWIMQIKQEIQSGKYDLVVVPDCRFINEIELIESLGGTLIRMEREGSIARDSDRFLDTWTKWDHVSDRGADAEGVKKFGRKMGVQYLEGLTLAV
jgi:hypothetical protein